MIKSATSNVQVTTGADFGCRDLSIQRTVDPEDDLDYCELDVMLSKLSLLDLGLVQTKVLSDNIDMEST